MAKELQSYYDQILVFFREDPSSFSCTLDTYIYIFVNIYTSKVMESFNFWKNDQASIKHENLT